MTRLDLFENRKHCLLRACHGSQTQLDIGLARAGLIRHRIDRVENLGVLIQRVVDQDGAARLIFTEQILHQVHAQLGEIGIELEAKIRFLRFLDLVDFVGGQKVVLRHQWDRQ